VPIEGVCPTCGARFDLAHALQDTEARKALAIALEMPVPLARLVVPYVGLHAPSAKRIVWRKLTRILGDLVALINSGQVTHGGQSHAAPLDLWKDGIERVLQAAEAGQLTLPLEGHGYLTKVVWTEAKRRAGRQAAAQKPLHPSHRPAAEAERRQNPAAIAEHLEQMKRSVGKR